MRESINLMMKNESTHLDRIYYTLQQLFKKSLSSIVLFTCLASDELTLCGALSKHISRAFPSILRKNLTKSKCLPHKIWEKSRNFKNVQIRFGIFKVFNLLRAKTIKKSVRPKNCLIFLSVNSALHVANYAFIVNHYLYEFFSVTVILAKNKIVQS